MAMSLLVPDCLVFSLVITADQQEYLERLELGR
jgi:hypothetical protein